MPPPTFVTNKAPEESVEDAKGLCILNKQNCEFIFKEVIIYGEIIDNRWVRSIGVM
jgi:hypothetical protein